jgi:hypothetical protein
MTPIERRVLEDRLFILTANLNDRSSDSQYNASVMGAMIPILSADPVAAATGQVWVLKIVDGGGFAAGSAMGVMGLTYPGATGEDIQYWLSVSDGGLTVRTQLT